MRRRNSRRTRGIWLVGLAVLIAASGAEAFGGKDRTPQIRVVGQGRVTSAPDRVSLDVAVVTRAATASEAASRNAEATASVLAGLRKAFPVGAEISTSGYALNAEYDYDKREGKRTPAGFSARNTIHVQLAEVTKAGDLIDAAVAAGANDVQGVRFSVSDPEPFMRQALAEAAADARARAAALAEGIGARAGRTLRIEESGASHPRPQVAFRAMEADATPIEPGDVVFEATVSLWVELEQK